MHETAELPERGYDARYHTPDEWLASQADYYRSLDTPWSIRLAKEIDSLASDVRFTGAASPDVLDDRLEVMERVERSMEDMSDLVRRYR